MIGAAGIGCGAHPEELALGEGQGALEPGGGIGLAERQLRVQMLQGDGGPGKLDQGALDGAQPIRATEITFDIGDKAIECLGRASAAVELAARKQLRLGCLVRAATSLGFRVGNPSAIGWYQRRIFQHPCYP